jgi:hypothetical protein
MHRRQPRTAPNKIRVGDDSAGARRAEQGLRNHSSRSVCFNDLVEDRDIAASSGHELGAFDGREHCERLSLNGLFARTGFSQ